MPLPVMRLSPCLIAMVKNKLFLDLKICFDSHNKQKHYLVTLQPRRDTVTSQIVKLEHYHYWRHLALESINWKQK